MEKSSPTLRLLINKNAFKPVKYRGGCVAQALFRQAGHVSHNAVSLQFRLRSEGAKCRSREIFSPTVEIKSKKLALDVLAHIQSLASTTWTSRTDTDKRRLSDEVSAKVLLRNPAKDTTSSEQGLTGSLGADESKGFLSFVFFSFKWCNCIIVDPQFERQSSCILPSIMQFFAISRFL